MHPLGVNKVQRCTLWKSIAAVSDFECKIATFMQQQWENKPELMIKSHGLSWPISLWVTIQKHLWVSRTSLAPFWPRVLVRISFRPSVKWGDENMRGEDMAEILVVEVGLAQICLLLNKFAQNAWHKHIGSDYPQLSWATYCTVLT